MVGVMTLLIVGLVFGRKQFAYLEVAPGLYIIEVVTAALLCTTVVGGFVAATPVRRAWSKNVMSHLPRPLLLCSGVCLLLAVGKAVTHFASGGQAAGLQELPILVCTRRSTPFWFCGCLNDRPAEGERSCCRSSMQYCCFPSISW